MPISPNYIRLLDTVSTFCIFYSGLHLIDPLLGPQLKVSPLKIAFTTDSNLFKRKQVESESNFYRSGAKVTKIYFDSFDNIFEHIPPSCKNILEYHHSVSIDFEC